MLHRAILLQDSLGACYRRVLLTDCYVDTEQILALLVDDCIDSNGRLAGLAVTNDQFALTAPDGDHAVDRFDARLYGRIHRLARNHTRSNTLHRTIPLGDNTPLIAHWLGQHGYDPTQSWRTHR